MMGYASYLLLLVATPGTDSTDVAAQTVSWNGEKGVRWALAEANWRLRHGTPADEVEAWLRTQMPVENGTEPTRSWNAYEQASRQTMGASVSPSPIASGSRPRAAANEPNQDTHALPKTP